jgi:ribose transport system permease protein
VVAAVFLEQLVQFVVALGVSTAVQIIVQAVALAIGVSLYTVNWKALWSHRPGERGVATVS